MKTRKETSLTDKKNFIWPNCECHFQSRKSRISRSDYIVRMRKAAMQDMTILKVIVEFVWWVLIGVWFGK